MTENCCFDTFVPSLLVFLLKLLNVVVAHQSVSVCVPPSCYPFAVAWLRSCPKPLAFHLDVTKLSPLVPRLVDVRWLLELVVALAGHR